MGFYRRLVYIRSILGHPLLKEKPLSAFENRPGHSNQEEDTQRYSHTGPDCYVPAAATVIIGAGRIEATGRRAGDCTCATRGAGCGHIGKKGCAEDDVGIIEAKGLIVIKTSQSRGILRNRVGAVPGCAVQE